MHTTSVIPGDFRLWSQWQEDRTGPRNCEDKTLYIIDETTGRRYLNESEETVKNKAYILSFGGLLAVPIASATYAALRVFRLVSCYHFWPLCKKQRTFFRESLGNVRTDLLRLIATPFTCLGMLFCSWRALLGNHLDGRKLYATFERIQFDGRYFIAYCFQPDREFCSFRKVENEENV